MNLTQGHFLAYPSDARDLFRATVNNIEIEISSYCNRRCAFCPNSTIDRISEQKFMDDALFTSIISQLGQLQWAGTLSFHRYNEPLADRPYLLKRLTEAQSLAPTARLCLFTNGDYLTRGYLDAIHKAGCRAMIVSVYLQEGKPYNDGEMILAIKKRLEALDLPSRWEVAAHGNHFVRLTYRDMDLVIRGQDYFRSLGDIQAMGNRGGILDVNSNFQRVEPCMKPFVEMQIEVDGTLLPCCELRSDHPAHRSSILGKLQPGDDIVTAWAGPSYTKWRRALFSFEPKTGVCATCAAPGIGTSADVQRLVAEVRQNWVR